MLISLLSASFVYAEDDNKFASHLLIEFEEQPYQLNLTGVAKRKVLFFPVYTVAHYAMMNEIENYDDDSLFDAIVEPFGPKQVSIIFDRDLKAEKVKDNLTKGINKNCVGDEFVLVQPALEEFRQLINQDVKKHDKFSLRWLPDGHIVAIYQDNVVGKIKSKLLAHLLWSIWFGDYAVVDRTNMISRLNIEH